MPQEVEQCYKFSNYFIEIQKSFENYDTGAETCEKPKKKKEDHYKVCVKNKCQKLFCLQRMN